MGTCRIDMKHRLGLITKFCSEKICGIDSKQFLLLRGKKCSFRGIPIFSKESISQFGTERNKTEFYEIMKFHEAANRSRLFQVFSVSQKWFGTDFRVFSVPRIGLEQNSEVFFSSENGS